MTIKALKHLIEGLKPITKEMVLGPLINEHRWDMRITHEKAEEGSSVKMVRYVCSCGKHFYCPVNSSEAVMCNNGCIQEFSASVRKRRRHQNSVARIFIEYLPEEEVFVWRYVRLFVDVDAPIETEGIVIKTYLTVVMDKESIYCFSNVNDIQESELLDSFFPEDWKYSEAKLIKLNDVDKAYASSFLKDSGAREEWLKNPQSEWTLNRKKYLYTWFDNRRSK